ncbi:hypothetical protein [uncultured Brevundimonas sp.]|uniref:hypothetical protein n=1 Tax=uncultured Brevundimonas sp. TaxID=213418 RepID=UPI002637AAC0|nr:hypothetical protein [uncultured Brevundimonas sp.]
MTNDHEKFDGAGAMEALNSIRETRAQALGKMDYWPWWYDAGYAASCALLVAGQGLGAAIGMVCTAVAISILLIIMRKWQADAGVWVNGYSPKRARWAAFGLAGLLIGLMVVSVVFGRVQGIVWVPLACGAVAAVLGLVGMRVWMALYRKDVKDLK